MSLENLVRITGFDMGFCKIPGHAAASVIKFSLDDGGERLVLLPRPVAVSLIGELFSFAQCLLQSGLDADELSLAIARTEKEVVAARPTLTQDDTDNPSPGSLVMSFTSEEVGSDLVLELTFGDKQQHRLVVDPMRAIVLAGYTNNVVEASEEDTALALDARRH